jgi:hypothetical protein
MADEYLDIAHGDTRLANALRRIIVGLADDGTEILREMARDILDGGSLRAAFFSGVYAEEIEAPFRRFWTTSQDMSAEEREQLRTRAREYLAVDQTP